MQSLRNISTKWLTRLQRSLTSLTAQHNGLNLPAATRTNGGTSLVYTPAQKSGSPNNDNEVIRPARVFLVEWQLSDARAGRIVDLDRDFNLIPVVPVGSKKHPQNFLEVPGSKLLVPQTGITWSRDRRSGRSGLRNTLPECWKQLVEMWHAALSTEHDNCELCECQAESHPCEDDGRNGVSDSDSGICSICLLTLHASCAKQIKEVVFGSSTSASASASSSSSPTTSLSFTLPSKPFAGDVFPEEFMEWRLAAS